MTKKEKLFDKFIQNPESIKYRELNTILENLWFLKIEAKGSHVKFKHVKIKNDIIIPVHNNECKDFYKKQTYKILKNNSLI